MVFGDIFFLQVYEGKRRRRRRRRGNARLFNLVNY